MKKLLLVSLLLLSFSCKGKFIVEVTREPFQIKETHSCKKCDICWHYGMSPAGKHEYHVDYSCSCKGTQRVLVEVTPYEGYYEKEPDVYLKRTKERVIRTLTICN